MTHPITPSPELARQWSIEAEQNHQPTVAYSLVTALATRAAQWGADQELEACCAWLKEWQEDKHAGGIENLRAARRPKPPSLKEQARSELIDAYNAGQIDDSTYDTIRRALEALPDD
jgi:hypothetical protein